MSIVRHRYLLLGLLGSAAWVSSLAGGESIEVRAAIWLAVGGLAAAVGYFLDSVVSGNKDVRRRPTNEPDASEWQLQDRCAAAETQIALKSGPWRFPPGHAPELWTQDESEKILLSPSRKGF